MDNQKSKLNLPLPDVSGVKVPTLTTSHINADEVKVNARIRYLPDESGVYKPYELLAFSKRTFIPPGWESSAGRQKKSEDINEFFDGIEDSEFSRRENRRKAYQRARNNLFNYAMATTSFNCFVTLTFDANCINRYSYDDIIKKLNIWFDNRVRRKGLCYVFVPEYHKDGAVHFHGLCNFEALKTERSRSPYTGKLLYDAKGRPEYNIVDFKLGHTLVIPLSGENARIATTKYVYKYITKTDGKMVGGRYYLSGGNLGRPKYKLLNINYDTCPGNEVKVGGIIEVKKYKFAEGESEFDFIKNNRQLFAENFPAE